jgi:hypothetical protein
MEAAQIPSKKPADPCRDFFVKHSDDEEREARYLHRTWRKADGGFYVGIDPPEGAKAEGIVRSSEGHFIAGF